MFAAEKTVGSEEVLTSGALSAAHSLLAGPSETVVSLSPTQPGLPCCAVAFRDLRKPPDLVALKSLGLGPRAHV